MPVIQINLTAGRTKEQIDQLAKEVTASACRILQVTEPEVVILFHEIPPALYYEAGTSNE